MNFIKKLKEQIDNNTNQFKWEIKNMNAKELNEGLKAYSELKAKLGTAFVVRDARRFYWQHADNGMQCWDKYPNDEDRKACAGQFKIKLLHDKIERWDDFVKADGENSFGEPCSFLFLIEKEVTQEGLDL